MKQLKDSNYKVIGVYDRLDRHKIHLFSTGTISLSKQVAMSMYQCYFVFKDASGKEVQLTMQEFLRKSTQDNGRYIYNYKRI